MPVYQTKVPIKLAVQYVSWGYCSEVLHDGVLLYRISLSINTIYFSDAYFWRDDHSKGLHLVLVLTYFLPQSGVARVSLSGGGGGALTFPMGLGGITPMTLYFVMLFIAKQTYTLIFAYHIVVIIHGKIVANTLAPSRPPSPVSNYVYDSTYLPWNIPLLTLTLAAYALSTIGADGRCVSLFTCRVINSGCSAGSLTLTGSAQESIFALAFSARPISIATALRCISYESLWWHNLH